MQNKLNAWKGKFLSFGGKHILINSVLQSIPIYLLSSIILPKWVIYDLHRIFARFLWNFKDEGRNKHWVAWIEVFCPKKERACALGLFLMCPKLYMSISGGILEIGNLYGLILYGQSIVKGIGLK